MGGLCNIPGKKPTLVSSPDQCKGEYFLMDGSAARPTQSGSGSKAQGPKPPKKARRNPPPARRSASKQVYVGADAQIQFANPVVKTSTGYSGTIEQTDNLFEAFYSKGLGGKLDLRLYDPKTKSTYRLILEDKKIILQKKEETGTWVAEKNNIRTVLENILGPDKDSNPPYLWSILKALNSKEALKQFSAQLKNDQALIIDLGRLVNNLKGAEKPAKTSYLTHAINTITPQSVIDLSAKYNKVDETTKQLTAAIKSFDAKQPQVLQTALDAYTAALKDLGLDPEKDLSPHQKSLISDSKQKLAQKEEPKAPLPPSHPDEKTLPPDVVTAYSPKLEQTQDSLARLFIKMNNGTTAAAWEKAAEGGFTREELQSLGIEGDQLEQLKDKLADGSLSREEAKALGIGEKLYDLMLNLMDAEGTTTSGELDVKKLIKAATVIAAYADKFGISQDEAVSRYKNTKSFINVNFDAIGEVNTLLAAKFSADLLTKLQASSETPAGRVKLIVKTTAYNEKLIELIVKEIKDWSNITALDLAKKFADFMERTRLGIIKPKDIDSLEAFPKATYYTAENIQEWYKTGKTTDTDTDNNEGEDVGAFSRAEYNILDKIQNGEFNSTEAIAELEKIKNKHPKNLKIRLMLADKYDKTGEIDKSLNEIMFVIERDPKNSSFKELLIQTTSKYIAKFKDEVPTTEQRELLGKIHKIFKGLDENTLSDPKIKTAFSIISKATFELNLEPIPGKRDFQKVITADDATLTKTKEAYDKFADELSKAITTEETKGEKADKEYLARMYAEIAQVESTRRNYEITEKYSTKLISLYSEIKEDLKESIKAIIKTTVEKLCKTRHSEWVKIAQRIIKAAEDKEILADLEIKITIFKKKDTKVENEEITVKSTKDLDSLISENYKPTLAAEVADYVLSILSTDGFKSLPKAQKLSICLTVAYILEKTENLKLLQQWANGFAKGELLPNGKFKNKETALAYLESLVAAKSSA